MTSKITPSCKTFTASSTGKSFYTSIAILPRTARVIRSIFVLIVLLSVLLLLHVNTLEWSLCVSCWEHWHLLLQLRPRVIAHALCHVLLELSLGGSGNGSRAFSIQHVSDIHS